MGRAIPVQQITTLSRALPVNHISSIVSIPSLFVSPPNGGKPDLFGAVRAIAPKINNTLKIQAPHIPNISNLPHKIESTLVLRTPDIKKPSLIPKQPDMIVKPSVDTLGVSTAVAVPVPIKTTINLPESKMSVPDATSIDSTPSTLVQSTPSQTILAVQDKSDFWTWFMKWLSTL